MVTIYIKCPISYTQILNVCTRIVVLLVLDCRLPDVGPEIIKYIDEERELRTSAHNYPGGIGKGQHLSLIHI